MIKEDEKLYNMYVQTSPRLMNGNCKKNLYELRIDEFYVLMYTKNVTEADIIVVLFSEWNCSSITHNK